MANQSRVWLRLDQVHLAIQHFTDAPIRRAALRVALRELRLQWQAGWNYCFADTLKHVDKEFAAYLLEMGA